MEYVEFHSPSYQSTSRPYDQKWASSLRPLFWSGPVSVGLLAFEADPWNSDVVRSTTGRCQAIRQAHLPLQRVQRPEKASALEARRRFYLRSLPRQSPHDQQRRSRRFSLDSSSPSVSSANVCHRIAPIPPKTPPRLLRPHPEQCIAFGRLEDRHVR